MAPRLVSRAAFARMIGLTKQAISKRFQKDLAPALVGDAIDLDHPLVQAFLSDRGVAAPARSRAPTHSRKSARVATSDPTDSPRGERIAPIAPTTLRHELGADDPVAQFTPGSREDLDALTKMLRPLVERFGTDEGCKNWMIALKEKENIIGKRLDNEETEGLLIPREFVTVHILSFLEETNKRLLGDLPKTLSRRLFALAASKATHEEAEREVREAVSGHLEAVSKKLSKVLRDVARRASEKNARAEGGTRSLAG